jgi:hypothetical protein
MGLGDKIISGVKTAYRIGKKIYSVYKAVVGGKKNTETRTTEAQDKYADRKALSSEDFKREPPPPPKEKTIEEKRSETKRVPMPTAQLPQGGSVKQKVIAVKQASRSVKQIANTATSNPAGAVSRAKAERDRLRNIASAPPKRRFEATARQAQIEQKSRMVGSLSDKERRKLMRQAQRAAKKRSSKAKR